MLPFILFKDLGATPFQVALMAAIKPCVSLISFYWGSGIKERPDRLVSNIIWGSILGTVPFLFFPFIHSIWFFILAMGTYMFFHRGVIPAWMELLKQNIHEEKREKTFASATLLGYIGDGMLPFLYGPLCDHYPGSWRWVFFGAGLLSLLSVLWQLKVPIKHGKVTFPTTLSFSTYFFKPLKDAWQLLQSRPDFAHFQMGFMFGGAGLMVMQVAMPQFVMGVLQVSYTELAIALTFCKGIGVALSSHFWASRLKTMSIFSFCAKVTAIAALFPLCIFVAKWNLAALFIAFILYGVMQAGSEMGWNLSGPIFSTKEDSSLYTAVNVLTVGIRGLIAPLFSYVLFQVWGPSGILILGGALCVMATAWMLGYKIIRVNVS
jgi:hypothetical protein